MKKLKLDPDALAVTSFATDTVPQPRGTIEARGLPVTQGQITLQPEITTSDSPNTWGTGPCTTAPSSDFPCDGNDAQVD